MVVDIAMVDHSGRGESKIETGRDEFEYDCEAMRDKNFRIYLRIMYKFQSEDKRGNYFKKMTTL